MMSAAGDPFKDAITMMPKRALAAIILLVGTAFVPPPGIASEDRDKPAPSPAGPAERVAGRWRITLEGLSADHEEILASLAVDGGLLVGTLSVGREIVKIASGKIVGSEISFAFRHAGGSSIKMLGSATPRGLEGTWEAGGEKGRWRARRSAS